MLFPSTTDTFGNAVLESLACGTPALVSDIGGPSEIVHHAETGIVLPAGDIQRWKAAVTQLVSDPARLESMSKLARAYAEDCTFERARDETWDYYAGHIDRFRKAIREEAL